MYGDKRWLEFDGFGRAVAVRTLLILTCIVFVIQFTADRVTGGLFTAFFGLSRAGLLSGALWQLVTYLFLHGGFWHILMNMFGLVMFGRELEDLLGARRFCVLYLGCGFLAGLGWVLISGSGGGPCIGASGAVFGVIGAFAAAFPRRRVMLIFPPVVMTARAMAVTFGLITLMLLFTTDGNIAHAAHLAGGIAGYVYGRERARRGGWIGIDRGGGPGEGVLGRVTGMRARWRRNKFRLLSSEPPTPSPEEVDRILDKINAQGIGSLTPREREALERASQRQGN